MQNTQQNTSSQASSQSQQRSGGFNAAELAVRGGVMLWDIQMAGWRNLWQIQTRAAAAVGGPDYSDFLRSADDGVQRLVSTSAEQLLNSTRQATQTVSEIQRQMGRLVEQGTVQASEGIRQGIEDLSQRAQQGLEEVRNLVQEGSEDLQRAGQQAQQGAQQGQNAANRGGEVRSLGGNPAGTNVQSSAQGSSGSTEDNSNKRRSA